VITGLREGGAEVLEVRGRDGEVVPRSRSEN
jgi:hypothetical protein